MKSLSKKRLLLTFPVFVATILLNEILEFTNNMQFVNENIIIIIRCFLFSIGAIDVFFLTKDILDMLLNKILRHVWQQIKDSVQGKIFYCISDDAHELQDLSSENIIKELIAIYPDIDKRRTTEMLDSLRNSFYDTYDRKDEISYFFIENCKYNSISEYIRSNQQFLEDCNKHSCQLQSEFFKIDLSSNNRIESKYTKNLMRLLHMSLKDDLINEKSLDVLRNFFSWFSENLKKKFVNLSREQVLLALRIILKIEKQIIKKANSKQYVNNKNIKNIIKEIHRIKRSLQIKKIVNSTCNEICCLHRRNRTNNTSIDEYARKTGLIISFFDDVTILKKIKLCISFYIQNKNFNNSYHNETRVSAVHLLLGAEVLVAGFSPDDCFNEKITNLIISIADLLF